MNRMYVDMKPGERVSRDKDDPTALLLHDGASVGDTVRVPSNIKPDWGGGQVLIITKVEDGPCPLKEHNHTVRICSLDHPSGLKVAECNMSGFLWHRGRNKE